MSSASTRRRCGRSCRRAAPSPRRRLPSLAISTERSWQGNAASCGDTVPRVGSKKAHKGVDQRRTTSPGDGQDAIDKLGGTGSSPVPPIISPASRLHALPILLTKTVSRVLVRSQRRSEGPCGAQRRRFTAALGSRLGAAARAKRRCSPARDGGPTGNREQGGEVALRELGTDVGAVARFFEQVRVGVQGHAGAGVAEDATDLEDVKADVDD